MDYKFINDFARSFNSIILEALPFVVLGVVIAGILEEFVPQTLVRQFFASGQDTVRRGGWLGFVQRLMRIRILAIAVGALLGLVFPMCECGIIAIMRRLIRKGLPLSVCISYTLCGPIINVVVLLSTLRAFYPPDARDFIFDRPEGWPLPTGPFNVMLLRAGLGFIVACVAALVADRQYRKYGKVLLHPSLVALGGVDDDEDLDAEPIKEHRPLARRLAGITEVALSDFIDIMAFLALGAVLATFGRMSVDNPEVNQYLRELLASESPLVPAGSIVLMMALAVLFCLCSEADAFVAANFPSIWPPASKMAFLVLGPMFDLKLLVMYTAIFRKRLIITIVLTVMIQVFLYTLALHYLWPDHGYSQSVIHREGITRTQGR
jgi:uncharacterized membrane protein YraQ (UPF0718 family)